MALERHLVKLQNNLPALRESQAPTKPWHQNKWSPTVYNNQFRKSPRPPAGSFVARFRKLQMMTIATVLSTQFAGFFCLSFFHHFWGGKPSPWDPGLLPTRLHPTCHLDEVSNCWPDKTPVTEAPYSSKGIWTWQKYKENTLWCKKTLTKLCPHCFCIFMHSRNKGQLSIHPRCDENSSGLWHSQTGRYPSLADPSFAGNNTI